MPLPIFQHPVSDAQGNLKPLGTITVTRESDSAIQILYADREGVAVAAGDGIFTVNTVGFATFYLPPGIYKMVVSDGVVSTTYRYVHIADLVDPIIDTATSRNCQLIDIGNIIVSNNASGFTYNVSDSVLSDVGQKIHFRQFGAGAITIVADTHTIQAPSGGTLVSAGQGASMTLQRISTTQLILMGHTVAA